MRTDNAAARRHKPVWTCCLRRWEERGCTPTYHAGPLLTEVDKHLYYGRWPDKEAVKYYFPSTTQRWREERLA